MKRTCRLSGEAFEITEADLAFHQAISPVFNGRKFDIPPPTLCPEERQRRRFAFRNLRHLYHRNCDLTGRKIISCFPQDCGLTVYYTPDWWSDAWDGLDYGREFDFGRPFFEQFRELYYKVPVFHLFVTHNENCEYVSGVANCRNCYLCFNIDHCEDCLYLTNSAYCTSSLDSLSLKHCELCYDCIDCANCYGLSFSRRCSNCYDSHFMSHCRNCRNCIGCSNLIGKEYFIFNKKVSRQEFETYKLQFENRNTLDRIRHEVWEHHLSHPVKYYFGHSNEDFSGDTIEHVRNSYRCFDCFELENCSYCNYVFNAANCQDLSVYGDYSQWIYECVATGMNCSNNLFCMGCWAGSSNNIYCNLVTSCNNCFGCSGLKHKSYCIFNKQYSREDYEKIVARIVSHMQGSGEWGEFFPASLSPHDIHETLAQEYSPISREEALCRGYRWRKDPIIVTADISLPKCCVPLTVADISDGDFSQPFNCSTCAKAFKIVARELEFHLRAGLPLSPQCPECRHLKQLSQRPSYGLWPRACAKCSVSLETAYQPDRPEKVYCERCYLEAVS